MQVILSPSGESKKNFSRRIKFISDPAEVLNKRADSWLTTSVKAVTLSCAVKGFPAPKIRWTTNHDKNFNRNYVVETKIAADEIVSVFEYRIVGDKSANVTCEAENALGFDSKTFEVVFRPETTTTTSWWWENDREEVEVATSTVTTASKATTSIKNQSRVLLNGSNSFKARTLISVILSLLIKVLQ